MDEKRRIERLKKNNQVTITIVSNGETNSGYVQNEVEK